MTEGALSSSGKPIWHLAASCSDCRFGEDGLLPLMQTADGKWGYVDVHGKWIVPPSFSGVSNFDGGIALVRDGSGRAGAIDSTGRVLIVPRFDEMGQFHDGLAWVSVDGRTALVNRMGVETLSPPSGARFPTGAQVGDGLVTVVFDASQLAGAIDTSGKLVIEPRFARLGPFHDGIAAAWVGNPLNEMVCGYLDRSGHWLAAPRWKACPDFANGSASPEFWQGGAIGPVDALPERVDYIDTSGRVFGHLDAPVTCATAPGSGVTP